MRLEIREVWDGHEHLGVTDIYIALKPWEWMCSPQEGVRRGEESLDREGVNGWTSEVEEKKKTGQCVVP